MAELLALLRWTGCRPDEGCRLTAADVIAKSGSTLTTVQGGTIGVRYYPWLGLVSLRDKDWDALNPWIVRSKLNIGAGNAIVHGISLVLRPVNLPSRW